MGSKRFRTGSILVLFSVTVLCVAIFAALTVSAAHSRQQTARRFASHITELTQCENSGNLWLCQMESYRLGQAALPENTTLEGNLASTYLTCGRVGLTVEVRLTDGGCQLITWSCVTRWQPDTTWNLWEG